MKDSNTRLRKKPTIKEIINTFSIYWKHFKIALKFSKEGIDHPIYLLFHVTHRCTLNCLHCFVDPDARHGKKRGQKKFELTVEEVEKMTTGMKPLLWINFTGGEPFIRADLPEIMHCFYKNTNTRIFKIDSNGSLENRAIESIKKMCILCPEANIIVNLSIDGHILELHNKIRNNSRSFNKVVSVYYELSKLSQEKQYSNLGVSVEVTISHWNQNYLSEIYKFYTEELKVNNFAHVLVRGEPYDPESKKIDIDKYIEFNDKANIFNLRGGGYAGFPVAILVNTKNILARKIIAKIHLSGKHLFTCYANKLNATLYANGDFVICELRHSEKEVFGNIRDFGLNFNSLWTSTSAEKARKNVQRNQKDPDGSLLFDLDDILNESQDIANKFCEKFNTKYAKYLEEYEVCYNKQEPIEYLVNLINKCIAYKIYLNEKKSNKIKAENPYIQEILKYEETLLYKASSSLIKRFPWIPFFNKYFRKIGILFIRSTDFPHEFLKDRISCLRCTHECYLNNGIIFNPKSYPSLIKEFIKIITH